MMRQKQRLTAKMRKEPELEDGTYKVDFNTDSGMFHENPDYNDGKATLTVKDGKMTVHITLNSKKYRTVILRLSKRCTERRGRSD